MKSYKGRGRSILKLAMTGMCHPTFWEPEGVHDMLRVWVCAAHMEGFLAGNSLNIGSFFRRFSLNMDGFSRNRQKIVKNR